MTDKEKVIKGLECCTNGEVCFSDCPYFKEVPMTDGRCITALQADAFALLKDPDRIKATRCKDCRYFEPSNAEEGDYSGYCRNDYAPCQNQTVDAWWFCGSADRR